MADLLFEIGSVIIFATLLAYVARLIKQPMILGYIIAGFIAGPHLTGLISSTETIELLSHLGIAFVLFIVGLEMDLNRIKNSGIKSAAIGLGQVAFTGTAGYALALFLGFSAIESLYVAAALTISSTMVVIKLLSDRGILDTLYGRIILGILLVQDVIAIFLLALLPTLEASGGSIWVIAVISLAKGALLFMVAYLAAKFVLPVLFNFSARSTELLFLSTVSWLFAFSFLADWLGYSAEIGAFIAGVTLASSSYKFEMLGRARTLRDFFVTVFFVSLGMQIAIPDTNIESMIIHVMLLSAFIILWNTLVVTGLALLAGYNKRISIMAGLPLGQVSEFSLILVVMGTKLGHVSSSLSALIVTVAAITITSTTYVVKYNGQICGFICRLFHIRNVPEQKPHRQKFDVVLCGYNRIAYGIFRKLKKLRKSVLVADFNPDVIKRLKSLRIPCAYGDIMGKEFIEKLNVSNAEMLVSTIPGYEENQLLIREARKASQDVRIIVTSNSVDSALKLYHSGANYVIFPQLLGGEHVAELLEKFSHVPSLAKHKVDHIRELHVLKRAGLGRPL